MGWSDRKCFQSLGGKEERNHLSTCSKRKGKMLSCKANLNRKTAGCRQQFTKQPPAHLHNRAFTTMLSTSPTTFNHREGAFHLHLKVWQSTQMGNIMYNCVSFGDSMWINWALPSVTHQTIVLQNCTDFSDFLCSNKAAQGWNLCIITRLMNIGVHVTLTLHILVLSHSEGVDVLHSWLNISYSSNLVSSFLRLNSALPRQFLSHVTPWCLSSFIITVRTGESLPLSPLITRKRVFSTKNGSFILLSSRLSAGWKK